MYSFIHSFIHSNCKLELLDAAERLTQYLRPGRHVDIVFTTLVAGRLTVVGQYRGRILLKYSCAHDTARFHWYRIVQYPILVSSEPYKLRAPILPAYGQLQAWDALWVRIQRTSDGILLGTEQQTCCRLMCCFPNDTE